MNVRAHIRRAIKRASSGASPAEIATAVLDELPDGEVLAALQCALPYLVRDEVRKQRHNALGVAAPRGKHSWQEPAPMPSAALSGPQRRAAARKASDAAQAKIDREQELLKTPVSIASGRWKALGDCTPADLRTLARRNRSRASENVARAEGFERLADDMEESGIAHVRNYREVGLVRQVFVNAV